MRSLEEGRLKEPAGSLAEKIALKTPARSDKPGGGTIKDKQTAPS